LAGIDHFIEFCRYHVTYALQELRLLSGEYWHWVLSKGINDSLVALRYILKLSHVRIPLQLAKAFDVVLVQGIRSFLRHLDILGIEFLVRAISLRGGASPISPASVVAAATATASEAASKRHV
jgi:hypothetical protein